MSKGGAVVGTAIAVAATAVVGANPGLLRQVSKVSDRISVAAASFSDHKPRTGRPRHRDTDGPLAGNSRYRALYKQAGARSSCGVSWRVLAAIGYVESRHGANPGPSSAGALGPMQFMPATWREYGRDGNRDGLRNIHDPADAIPAAAALLCANGAGSNLRGAIWRYNHSWSYVDLVVATSRRIR
jgi:membrane-bound lytic murein transglycosylase B